MSEVNIPRLPDMIDVVRAEGGLIHNLPPSATQQLAERHGIYTTTEQRNPGTLLEFQRTWRREQAFAEIARNVGTILGKTKQYQDAVREGTLGERLVEAFGSVTRVECDDVHLIEHGEIPKDQKGIVTATETRLTVPNNEQADRVSVAIQGLLSTGSVETFYPVTVDKAADDSQPVVKIGMLDEHAARSLSRSLEAVKAQEDKENEVTLPPDKRTYAAWKASGETFPPAVEQRLVKAAEDYEQLELAGTYRGRPDVVPRPKPRIIGTDAAAMLEGMRDVLNGLIHAERGGSHLNLEQHPIKAARPLVEVGVDLRRDKTKLEDVRHGPPSSRPPRLTEQSVEQGRERFEDIRRHPIRAIAKGLSSALSLPSTALDLTGKAVEYLPAGSQATRELAEIRQEWRKRRAEAAVGGERLDKLSTRLRREEAGLIVWE